MMTPASHNTSHMFSSARVCLRPFEQQKWLGMPEMLTFAIVVDIHPTYKQCFILSIHMRLAHDVLHALGWGIDAEVPKETEWLNRSVECCQYVVDAMLKLLCDFRKVHSHHRAQRIAKCIVEPKPS